MRRRKHKGRLFLDFFFGLGSFLLINHDNDGYGFWLYPLFCWLARVAFCFAVLGMSISWPCDRRLSSGERPVVCWLSLSLDYGVSLDLLGEVGGVLAEPFVLVDEYGDPV